MQPLKLYVLTRTDLPDLTYSGVQGGHALAQYIFENPDTAWKNGTLVYLGVTSEAELARWRRKLERKGIKYAQFHEPDIGNQLTAIAAVTDTKIFSKLKLLGEYR